MLRVKAFVVACQSRISWPWWRQLSILAFLLNAKILHRGQVVLPGDLGLVVLLGGLAQVALEAEPGEAGGDTVQEEQGGTVHDLLWSCATPEAADVEGEGVDDGEVGGDGGGVARAEEHGGGGVAKAEEGGRGGRWRCCWRRPPRCGLWR